VSAPVNGAAAARTPLSRLGWYLKRLRVMSAREIAHRLGEQATLISLFARYLISRPDDPTALNPSMFAFCSAERAQLPPQNFDPALESYAVALLEGRLNTVDRWQWQPEGNCWHRAPDSGREWPTRFFWAIPYRSGNGIGDVRHMWEPARLQHLVDLAALAASGPASRGDAAVGMIVRQLRSWVAANPPLVGVHYISAMECALRLIAVCHALDTVRAKLENDGAWHDLLALVRSHAPLIARRLSVHSSAGNHTVAECAGLVYAGTLFPELEDAPTWRVTGLGLLAQEAARQVLPDGGGIEQAFTYHRFNVQLLMLVVDLLDAHAVAVPQPLRSAAERGARFLSEMAAGGEGGLPQVGDSDGGFALSRYLRLPERTAAPPATIAFPDSGYTLVRTGQQHPFSLLLDHGPMGMAPAYGHAHADALSVLLWLGADECLVDTGTYTYTGDAYWRSYFRSTGAHNTVTVDGRDQAHQEACFLWTRPVRARLLDSELELGRGGRLLASHDGYRSLGVTHMRGLAWVQDGWLLIWDRLLGKGEHRLDLHWHLAYPPRRTGEDRFELGGTGGAEFACSGGTVSSASGQTEPALGWRSRRYGHKEPITTIQVSYHGSLPHEFVTLLSFGKNTPSDPTVEDALSWMRQHAG
jgi:hypothetical protein